HHDGGHRGCDRPRTRRPYARSALALLKREAFGIHIRGVAVRRSMPGARIEAGERVTLRTIEREDSEFLQRARTDPAIRHPLGTVRHKNLTQVEDHFEEFIEAEHNADFLVCLDSEAAGPGHPDEGDTTPIGVVNVMHIDWDRPNLAY